MDYHPGNVDKLMLGNIILNSFIISIYCLMDTLF